MDLEPPPQPPRYVCAPLTFIYGVGADESSLDVEFFFVVWGFEVDVCVTAQEQEALVSAVAWFSSAATSAGKTGVTFSSDPGRRLFLPQPPPPHPLPLSQPLVNQRVAEGDRSVIKGRVDSGQRCWDYSITVMQLLITDSVIK